MLLADAATTLTAGSKLDEELAEARVRPQRRAVRVCLIIQAGTPEARFLFPSLSVHLLRIRGARPKRGGSPAGPSVSSRASLIFLAHPLRIVPLRTIHHPPWRCRILTWVRNRVPRHGPQVSNMLTAIVFSRQEVGSRSTARYKAVP